MSNELGIGKIILRSAKRDAIHVAVVPAFATITVCPGESLYLIERIPDLNGCVWVSTTSKGQERIGIVDPFLPAPVPAGVGFWLFLTPGSVVGLRHDYRHPLLDGDEA
jgi:hypothetical protein